MCLTLETLLRVFDVCSEILRDSKSYFGFVVNKFSELVHTEIYTFSQFLCDHTASHGLKQTKCPAVKEVGEFLRIPLLQIQNKFYNRFAIPNKHQILSVHFDEAFCGKLVNNFDCRAFSLFETVAGSRIKTHAILQYAQAQLFCHLANEHYLWNRSTFLKKHQIIII